MTPVTSLEISKKLREAGIKMDTQFWWVDGELWDKTMQSDYETPSTPPRSEWLPSPLTDELLAMLPDYIGNKKLIIRKQDNDWRVSYFFLDTEVCCILRGEDAEVQVSPSLPDACALLLLELKTRAIIYVEK